MPVGGRLHCIVSEEAAEGYRPALIGFEGALGMPFLGKQPFEGLRRPFGGQIVTEQAAAATVFHPIIVEAVGIAVRGIPIDDGIHGGVGEPDGIPQPKHLCLELLEVIALAEGVEPLQPRNNGGRGRNDRGGRGGRGGNDRGRGRNDRGGRSNGGNNRGRSAASDTPAAPARAPRSDSEGSRYGIIAPKFNAEEIKAKAKAEHAAAAEAEAENAAAVAEAAPAAAEAPVVEAAPAAEAQSPAAPILSDAEPENFEVLSDAPAEAPVEE